MTKSDDDILEFLLNDPLSRLRASPRIVSANTDWSNRTVRRRLSKLRKAGLVEYYDKKDGIYVITDKGENYLRGTLEKSELRLD